MIYPTKMTSICATLMLAGIAHAQNPVPLDPEPPAPAAPEPVRVPVVGAEKEKPAVDGEPAKPNNQIKGSIEQPAMTGDIMASLYRTWTGKRVIVSQAAQAKTISFIQPGPLSYDEAARLLEKAALLEGLAFVPSGPNEVKLLVAGNSGKNGPPLVTRIEDLPEGEQLVTYVMTLENIKPEEAMNIFQGATKGLSEGGVIIPVPNTSSLIITENSALIKTLHELKEKIDKPQDLAVRRIITLEHADAEEVAEMVTTFMEFSAQQNTRFSTGTGASNAPRAGGNRPGGNGGNRSGGFPAGNRNNAGGESFASVQILAEPRTNRIFVMGRPIDIEFAMGMIKDIDAPISRRNLYKHKLSFLSVSDFLPIAQNAIELATSNNAEASGGGAAGGAGRGNTGGNAGGNPAAGGDNQAANSSDRAASSLDDSNRLEYPESILIGKTLLVADNANNSLIVQGPPQSITVVRDLIKEMDVSSDQVQITAVFGRYSLGKELNFGVDFGRTYQKTRGANSGFALQNRTSYPLLADPEALNSVGALNGLSTDPSAIAGLSLYGQIGKHFFPTLQALEGTGRFKLLARPKVFTTNNRKAILSSGQSIAVPTNSLSSNTGVGGNVSQSTNIAYRDVLLKLEVIPLVNNKDEVTLQISFVNDNVVGNQLIDGNEVPTIGKEEILTTVTVPNGETVVLGGLITERDEKSVSGIPILSSIPGIGKIFSSTQIDKNREELVIFIKPQIVGSRTDLDELQQYNQQESQLAEEIQSAGVLPVKDAEAYAEDAKPAPTTAPRTNRFRGLRR